VFPHEPQNRFPAGLVAPQEEQTASIADPHEPQKRWSAGLGARQTGHATSDTVLLPCSDRTGRTAPGGGSPKQATHALQVVKS
jgi:hypothetical protein